jgi:rhodanese-related sulfurtransferase
MNDGQSRAADYAGDVSPQEAWAGLARDKSSQLLDVRTRAEWSFVGLAELSAIGKSLLLSEWQSFPQMSLNASFLTEVDAALAQAGADRSAPVYCLCRSGARSRAAAIALTARGYQTVYNIAGGFEGDPDEDGHRGGVNGWKAEGLPWRQG